MSELANVDLTLRLHQETNRTILVSADGDQEKAVWLCKSLIIRGETVNDVVKVGCPIWLARERGLL